MSDSFLDDRMVLLGCCESLLTSMDESSDAFADASHVSGDLKTYLYNNSDKIATRDGSDSLAILSSLPYIESDYE